MLARRLAWTASLLILVVVVAASFSAREAQRTQAVAPPAGAQQSAPAPVAEGRLPADKVVRARVGDVVSVQVTSAQPDTATVDALGVSAPTSSDVPGTLEFVASSPGRYPVALEDSGTSAGTIVVSAGR